ncbi:hypothetical protein QFC19_006766 [Naganishia cerealis]|uniref:Uncharacterized protein n=1 Tax=Naganishia cerealis TaxID=610337 RepID=A0ACC2VDL7_9TREE|nr:hypothetical protein QFC19_006766 [Naganishia cerealis]
MASKKYIVSKKNRSVQQFSNSLVCGQLPMIHRGAVDLVALQFTVGEHAEKSQDPQEDSLRYLQDWADRSRSDSYEGLPDLQKLRCCQQYLEQLDQHMKERRSSDEQMSEAAKELQKLVVQLRGCIMAVEYTEDLPYIQQPEDRSSEKS